MLNEKLLDGMNFGELSQSLEVVLETIGKIEETLPKGADDARLDMLYVFADKIIAQMDAIIYESGSPAVIARWNKAKVGYAEHFENFTNILREEGTLPDFKKPEIS